MENGKLIMENEKNAFLHFPFSVIHYPLFQVFFEESQNTRIFISPAFGPDKAVIFRRIELFLKILRLAEPYKLFGQLHRILDVHIVVNNSVQDEERCL